MTDEEQEREGKPEQEAHMGRADRAEAAGQLALHRVARGLRRRRDDREHRPEPAGVGHGDGPFVMAGLVPAIYVFAELVHSRRGCPAQGRA